MSKILNTLRTIFLYRRTLKLGSRGLFCGCLRQMMLEFAFVCRYVQVLTTNMVRVRECLRLLGCNMAPVAKSIQTKQCHS